MTTKEIELIKANDILIIEGSPFPHIYKCIEPCIYGIAKLENSCKLIFDISLYELKTLSIHVATPIELIVLKI